MSRCVGRPEYNLRLSERRAEAACDYIASQGISASRLEVIGFGANRPIATNDTEAGRAENRRVEIILQEE